LAIKDEMIYDIDSDGEIEKRPVHLRKLCHIKYFLDREEKDLEGKLEDISMIIEHITLELE
jgi:hypothetical protein